MAKPPRCYVTQEHRRRTSYPDLTQAWSLCLDMAVVNSRPIVDILAGEYDRLYGPAAEQLRRQLMSKESITAPQTIGKLVAIFGGYLGLACKQEAGRRGGDVKRVNFEAMCMSNFLQSALNAFPLDFRRLRLLGFHVPARSGHGTPIM